MAVAAAACTLPHNLCMHCQGVQPLVFTTPVVVVCTVMIELPFRSARCLQEPGRAPAPAPVLPSHETTQACAAAAARTMHARMLQVLTASG